MYKTQPSKYQYNEMIERLSEAVEFYKRTDYKYNTIRAYLSKYGRLEFSFLKQNIPHLLGINIFNLKNRKILNATTPFEMLEELIDRSGYIYSKIEKGEISFFEIFSECIEEKIEFFPTALKFDLKDIHFVCEYVKARSYINGEANNYGCQYYVALKNENDQYVFLGLKKPEESRYYAPSSILTYNSKEECEKVLETLIGNQMITIVNSIEFTNNGFTRHLKVPDKLLLIKELMDLDEKYGSISSTTRDHLHSLKKALGNFDDKDLFENIVSVLTAAINQGKPISNAFIEKVRGLDNNMYSQLLESYNLSLKCAVRSDITSEIKELSDLRQKLLEAEKVMQEQKQVIQQQNETIATHESHIEKQESELQRLREFESESVQLVKKFCTPQIENKVI